MTNSNTIKLHITPETEANDSRFKDMLSDAVRAKFGGTVTVSVDTFPDTVSSDREDVAAVRDFVHHHSEAISDELLAKPDLFRVDEAYGNVYMWDEPAQAYIFYCKLDCFDEPTTLGEYDGDADCG